VSDQPINPAPLISDDPAEALSDSEFQRLQIKVSPGHAFGPGHSVALVATFAALIATCAMLPALAIAGVPAPVTLQTFGVMLTGLILGARRGAAAVLLYLVIGAAGAPVFSGGNAGLGVFVGPTAGYLVAFPLLAFLVGKTVRLLLRTFDSAQLSSSGKSSGLRFATIVSTCLLISVLTVHACGVIGMAWRVPMSFSDALVADLIFIPGDILKTTVAVFVSSAVLRALPQLRELN